MGSPGSHKLELELSQSFALLSGEIKEVVFLEHAKLFLGIMVFVIEVFPNCSCSE